MDGLFGLQGWQWLFLIEALPPIIMCFVIWFLLTDRPNDAMWLTPDSAPGCSSGSTSERRSAIRARFALMEALINPASGC